MRCLLQTRVANWGRGIDTTGYRDTSDQAISELQLNGPEKWPLHAHFLCTLGAGGPKGPRTRRNARQGEGEGEG
eukprot:scaffold6611_cov57-Phaeocystis_antarctica.AAC.1